MDGHEEWVENCGNRSCSHNHNIRKNAAMLPWTAMDMNWCDFLEVIDCYCCEHKALCSFCEKCRKFKLLCPEAETITLNSWSDRCDSFVVAVRFNSMTRKYLKTLPITVGIINRRRVDADENKTILEKEKIIIAENIIEEFRNDYYWCFFFFF